MGGATSNNHNGFPTTHWSLVLSVRAEDEKGRAALDDLCRKYWLPVRAFFSLNAGAAEADDLAQEYFASLLSRDYLRQADPERGRFRAFLTQDLKFFLMDALAKRRAKKRGAHLVFVPLDSSVAEAPEAALNTAAFDRQWALEVVRHAREELRNEFAAAGKGGLFRLLQHGLVKSMNAEDYERWAASMKMKAGSIKVALHRLRIRFRKALEDQVRETVSSEEDFAEEMRHLYRALREAALEEEGGGVDL